jgi:hypothetical protein
MRSDGFFQAAGAFVAMSCSSAAFKARKGLSSATMNSLCWASGEREMADAHARQTRWQDRSERQSRWVMSSNTTFGSRSTLGFAGTKESDFFLRGIMRLLLM